MESTVTGDRRRSGPVLALDASTYLIVAEYAYMAEAARALGVSRQAIFHSIVEGVRCRGFVFFYKAAYEAMFVRE